LLSFALLATACGQPAESPSSAAHAHPDHRPPIRSGDDHSPSTAEERRLAVEWTRSLEEDPLQPGADVARARLLTWVINVPDISVKLCGELLGPSLDRQGPFDAMLFGQLTFGGAAFSIEHPDRAGDAAAQRLAALQSALRVYERLRESRPEVRLPYLDDLLARRARNDLASLTATCPKT
jgi:hypothetical protein